MTSISRRSTVRLVVNSQAISVDFELSDLALTMEHAVQLLPDGELSDLFMKKRSYTNPIAIKAQIDTFVLKGS